MINVIKHFIYLLLLSFEGEKNMNNLIEELLAIMDEECEEYEEWETNKPTIINIYIGGDK